MVLSLISPQGQWNGDLMNDLFFPEDVRRIMSSPPNLSLEDCYFWAHTKHGRYEVMSGNDLILKQIWQAYEVSEDMKVSNDLKSRVWDINTIPKNSIFLWRALSGALAVAESLVSHGIQTALLCKIM